MEIGDSAEGIIVATDRTGDDRLSIRSPSAAGNNLEELLGQLLAGGTGGRGVPDPGQELVACGLRFVRPVDEHLSLNDVPVTPLLVSNIYMKIHECSF